MPTDEQIISKCIIKRQPELLKEYLNLCVPDYLSKFYSLNDDTDLNERKLNTLECNENWFDFAKNQNDPFDASMFYVDEAKAKERKLTQEEIESQRKLLNYIREHLRLCSFIDSDYRNLPMWAYYSNCYQGYCISYKINNAANFYKVLYLKERIKLSNFGLKFAKLTLEYIRNNKETNEFKLYEITMEILFNSKHISWQHEQEYRIMKMFDSKVGYVKNEELEIKINDITFGWDCKPEYQKRIIEISNNLKVPCYKLRMDDKNFLGRDRVN